MLVLFQRMLTQSNQPSVPAEQKIALMTYTETNMCVCDSVHTDSPRYYHTPKTVLLFVIQQLHTQTDLHLTAALKH